MEPYQKLEEIFGEWVGSENVVACSSGTSALHLALESLDLPKGSGVIVPEFTMVSCARAVVLAGLKPIFVDCGNDLLLDYDLIQKAVQPKNFVKAIMPVHIYGRQCNMARIREIADNNSLLVIEDMAEIHGINPHPDTDAACWSFYKNKIVAGEEGGAIAFKSREYADKAKVLRSVGLTNDHNFIHMPRGINARMSNSHARLILESFARVKYNISCRRRVEAWYNKLVNADYHMPPRDACWVYDVRIPGMNFGRQNSIIYDLNELGIAARHGFKPMSMQPEFANFYINLNACRLSQEIIYLPIYPEMTIGQVMDITAKFDNIVIQ